MSYSEVASLIVILEVGKDSKHRDYNFWMCVRDAEVSDIN